MNQETPNPTGFSRGSVSDLISQYLDSQNYAETTRDAKRDWLNAWVRMIGKPLEEATTEDILTLKKAFAAHAGRVPLKYYQALNGFYLWVEKVKPGFRNPTIGIEFSQGEAPAQKDALPREKMLILLEHALKQAGIPFTYQGSDSVKVGKQYYRLQPYLWYWVLRIAPVFLFRAHELLPYDAPHRVTIVDQEKYEVECNECDFKAGYWPDRIINADPRHVPNEKIAQFKFGTTVDSKGKEWTTATFLRKGRVRLNRRTGKITSEIHWADAKPLDKDTLHWLRMILLAPPCVAKVGTQTLNDWGDQFNVQLKNSKGEPIKLSFHIWAKHTPVTGRKLEGESNDSIARDADVAVASLRPYDHVVGKPEEVSRQVAAARDYWKQDKS